MLLRDIYGNWPVEFTDMQDRLDETLNPRNPEMLYDALSDLRMGAGSIVLDIGCGEGQHSRRLVDRFKVKVLGVDLVRENLRRAKEYAADAPGSIHLVQGTIEAIPLRGGSCDVVWCRDMLTHVDRVGHALVECARVLTRVSKPSPMR